MYYEIDERERDKLFAFSEANFLDALPPEQQQQRNIIEQALTDLDPSQRDLEWEIDAFRRRWDGIGEQALRRALYEGDEEEVLLAIFALGLMQAVEDTNLLSPFLSSANQRLRWASILSLGRKNSSRMFPMLKAMLEEDIVAPFPWGWEQAIWFFSYRSMAVQLLAEVNDPSIPSLLFHTLVQTYKLIHDFCQHMDKIDHDVVGMWRNYQDTLIYTLGQLGMFDKVQLLPYTPSYLHHCSVLQVLGYLRVPYVHSIDYRPDGESSESFQARVYASLGQLFGLSAEEQRVYLDDYKQCLLDRYFSPDPFWGHLEGAEEILLSNEMILLSDSARLTGARALTSRLADDFTFHFLDGRTYTRDELPAQ